MEDDAYVLHTSMNTVQYFRAYRCDCVLYYTVTLLYYYNKKNKQLLYT